MKEDDLYATQRLRMAQEQIRERGIGDPRLLAAFSKVPREDFVAKDQLGDAYQDHPSPIGHGQTISQPYIVAMMLASLELTGKERVLEIGTGSGYQTALLAELCQEVFSIERIPSLAASAQSLMEDLGYQNIRYRVSDGTLGWPEEAPFDAIVVSAAPREIPPSLESQIAVGGRMVIPVGDRGGQQLILVERRSRGRLMRRNLGGCVFVKLIGAQGWDQEDDDPQSSCEL